ncbi:MAG: DUF4248 domain-containing protein [Tannerellaceae bacterium]|nr:DUF4248 domain-containing protein [Tannerellaceae bacterium]
METMNGFAIRTYGLQELAQYYFPNIQENSATQQLKKWIRYNEELCKELKGTGYKPGVRLLTPRQVELIVHHLGLP